MPIFAYKAKDLQGLERKGTIEASDPRDVARVLSKRGLVVISVKESQGNSLQFLDKYLNRVSFTSLVAITRQLATMVGAGLVLSDSLDILSEQERNPKLKQSLIEVGRDIKGGLDFASALKKHPDVFPPLYSNLVRAGEQSGKLDIVLNQMATNLEREREFRSRVRGAMIYPMMIVGMMFIVMAVMMFFVIPRLTVLYSQSNIDLPLPTKILIGVSGFFTGFWWLIAIMTVVGIVAFKRWVATPFGRFSFDKFLLKVPVIKLVIQGTALTNFTRTFGLLTTAGVPILDSLTIVANIIGNSVYNKALNECVRGVERGLLLSTQLESTGVFPRILTQMYKVGEETGKVDELSFKLADYFESETDHLVKNLTVIIEPIILIVLGIGVAFLVLSIILPIYKLTTSFS